MGAGKLDRRYGFYKRPTINDGSGNTEGGNWEHQFTVAGGRVYLRGGESVMAGRLQNVQKVILTIRDSTQARQINAGWMAKDERGGTEYAIHEDPQRTDGYLEMLCQSGVAVG